MISNGESSVDGCSFVFTDSNDACSGLEINSPSSVSVIRCEFQKSQNAAGQATLYIHGDGQPQVNIDHLTFDSCIGDGIRAIDLDFNGIANDFLITLHG